MTGSHIQDFEDATQVEHHWGYADRVVPCTNDAGSCAYLDLVYGAHDRGMIYTGIIWLTFVFILILLTLNHHLPALRRSATAASAGPKGAFVRAKLATQAALRRHLLPNNPLRFVFGHVTRYQVSVFALLIAYLTIWSFIGMTYQKWITPVKKSPGLYNTRTSLGPWVDRIGVIAYALTPLSILLASRESFLSYATGIPYTSFLFLHRWVGYLIVLQSVLHTIGWILVEAWLYQPQPTIWKAFSSQLYIIWGFVGLAILILIWFLSLPWTVRNITGYEFFHKAHYVMAMVYISALIGHWKQLQCFLIPGIGLWTIDRALRIVRPFQLHDSAGTWGVMPSQARVQIFKDETYGDLIRLDFTLQHAPWKIGQHFFLCFPQCSWWQSHPFTPMSSPTPDCCSKNVTHSYIIRAKGGETKHVAALAAERLNNHPKATISVIATGAYGEDIPSLIPSDGNILCVAGGTGIAYVLPILLDLARTDNVPADRHIELVWAIRRRRDIEWIRPELEILLDTYSAKITVRVFVTGDDKPTGVTLNGNSSGSETDVTDSNMEKAVASNGAEREEEEVYDARFETSKGRPQLEDVVKGFVDGTVKGTTTVLTSGPLGMMGDLRGAVADCNDGGKVWKGEERYFVRLVCDERLEG